MKEDSKIVTDSKEILNELKNFYENLFKKREICDFDFETLGSKAGY